MSEITFATRQAMQKANAAYDRRDWVEAARLCRAVLEKQPATFDALHLLGIIAAQESRAQEAAQLLGRAVAARPDSASAHANLGNVLIQLERFDEAVASYDRALKIRPGNAMVYSNRGVALQALARFDAAVASYDRAIALKPDFTEAFFNRGNALQALEQPGAAVASYERAIALKPDYAEAYSRRGNALQSLKQHEAAVASYDRAIALKPGLADVHYNRGIALHAIRQDVAAVASYDRAIALRPGYAEAHANRGNSLHELRQHAAAVDSYDRAIALKPDFAEVHYNRGIALEALRQLDAAVESFDRAISFKPQYADAYWNKSLALLLRGDFKNGWELYEWRWRTDSLKVSTRGFVQPLWLGEEAIAGKTILLHAEQGMGDAIQFCRYASLVADLGARVILEAPVPLLSLFATLDGVSQLVAHGSSLPPFDCHCPLMSLPLALKTEVSSIPAPIAYLRSDPAKSRRWQEKLGEKNKLRVGLAWSGGFRRLRPDLWALNERRNISLAQLAPLRNERIDYYSLQKGEPAESELARMKGLAWNGPEMVDYTSALHDFSDTAALIDNLDLVISVDTSIAHLAGALGKPVWILNRFDTCWRWRLDRDDSPWYPTARLYRQARAGDWEGVVERVRADLERLSA
jgi:tetratricopeptide (TPR) repeat protein